MEAELAQALIHDTYTLVLIPAGSWRYIAYELTLGSGICNNDFFNYIHKSLSQNKVALA